MNCSINEFVAIRYNDFELKKQYTENGFLVLDIQSNNYSAKCPYCGVISQYVHQEKTRFFYDECINDNPVKINFKERRFKCKNKDCEAGTFIENLDFVEHNRNISNFIIKKIIANKEKTVRTIALNIYEQDKIKISKSFVANVINRYKYDEKFNKILILKNDRKQLETNIDEKIDEVRKIPYNSGDYILELVDNNFQIISKIKENFKTMSGHKTSYPIELFIMASLTAQLKNYVAVSSIPFAFTNISAITKIGYNILRKRANNSFFSEGAFRDYLMKAIPNNINSSFNEFINSLIQDIKPTLHIVDATKIQVNYFNSKYENSSIVTDSKGNKMRGYKLTTMYGYTNNQLILENALVTTVSESDITAFNNMLPSIKCLKENDIILFDRGYTSFDLFYDLLQKNIYIVTPAKKNSNLMKDAMFYIKSENNINWFKHPNSKRQNQEYTTITGLKVYEPSGSITTAREFDVVCAVIRFLKKDKTNDEEESDYYYEDDKYCYALIYSTKLDMDGKGIIQLYEKRMKIEDQYKNMKENFNLCDIKSRKYNFITFQILSTVTALDILQLFTLLDEGKKYKNKHLKTIIKSLDSTEKYKKYDYIVSSKDTYAAYKDADLFELLFQKPKETQDNFVKCLRTKNDVT